MAALQCTKGSPGRTLYGCVLLVALTWQDSTSKAATDHDVWPRDNLGSPHRGLHFRQQPPASEGLPLRWCGGASHSYLPWTHSKALRLANFTPPTIPPSQQLTSDQVHRESGMTNHLHHAVGKFGCSGTEISIPQENFGMGEVVRKMAVEDMSVSQRRLRDCLQDINQCNHEAAQAASKLTSIKLISKHEPAKLGRLPSFGSCALVGNSGHLLFRQYGQFIDKHDAVVRFNRLANEHKYYPHVGSKTTLRVLNHLLSKEGCCKKQLVPYRNTSFLIWHPGGKDEIMGACASNFPGVPVYSLDAPIIRGEVAVMAALRKDAMRFGLEGFGKWRQLTSGAHGVLLMLRMCKSVSLYGFTTYPSKRTTKDQYTGRSKRHPDGEWWHDFEGTTSTGNLQKARQTRSVQHGFFISQTVPNMRCACKANITPVCSVDTPTKERALCGACCMLPDKQRSARFKNE